MKGQAKPAATANIDIGRGRYTVIAVPDGDGVGLRVYKDGTAVPGKARMRTINAAAELDQAEMRVDGQAVARIHPTRRPAMSRCRPAATICRSPGRAARAALSRRRRVCRWWPGVPPPRSSSAARGEPAQVVMVSDQTAGPSVAPATGLLGDEGDGGPWLLVALAASVAGSLGGTIYLRTARRRPAAPLPAVGSPQRRTLPRPRSPPTPDQPAPW